jgi:hypothetical protein
VHRAAAHEVAQLHARDVRELDEVLDDAELRRDARKHRELVVWG